MSAVDARISTLAKEVNTITKEVNTITQDLTALKSSQDLKNLWLAVGEGTEGDMKRLPHWPENVTAEETVDTVGTVNSKDSITFQLGAVIIIYIIYCQTEAVMQIDIDR